MIENEEIKQRRDMAYSALLLDNQRPNLID